MKRECETCIKRKITYCPNSIECMDTNDMPFYQNRIMLLEENQELKKQLENYKRLGFKHLVDKNNNLETQQKEFIKYLEDEIKRINPNNLGIGELNLRLGDIKFTQYLIYKENLQKYKEIIGVSDENNKQ